MLEIVFLAVAIALGVALLFAVQKIFSLREELSDLRFKKSSQSVKYGRLAEQFIPFSQQFPFEPEHFRFLGEPVDGISFNENEIVFCEFKAASSQLSQKQKRIKDLVQGKKVAWLEFRMR